jgi:cytoskeleton-associated protein 2
MIWLVVASLGKPLEVEETECFTFRKNEALPVALGFEILEHNLLFQNFQDVR